jgi:hypothetical protein
VLHQRPDSLTGRRLFLVGFTAGEERQHDGPDCYVGSADAEVAIPGAGQLMPASDAVVPVIYATIREVHRPRPRRSRHGHAHRQLTARSKRTSATPVAVVQPAPNHPDREASHHRREHH